MFIKYVEPQQSMSGLTLCDNVILEHPVANGLWECLRMTIQRYRLAN